MNPIPLDIMDRKTSDNNFEKHLNSKSDSNIKVWALELKEGSTFIGIAAYLKNNQKEDEIAYRLIENFWGVGYGTEITKGLIDFGFNDLKLNLITADVNTSNYRSIKILDKFFKPDSEFYNESDKCIDRRYKLKKIDWVENCKLADIK